MLEVCNSYSLSDSTYFHSVVFLDKFIVLNKKIKIKRTNFQLIGMACLWIACKLKTSNITSKSDIIDVSDNSFSDEEMIEMEKVVLTEINFDINTPVLSNYIALYSKVLNLNKENNNKFNLYIHICSIFPEHYEYSFSDISYICAYLTTEENRMGNYLKECKDKIVNWIEEFKNLKDFESINDKFKIMF